MFSGRRAVFSEWLKKYRHRVKKFSERFTDVSQRVKDISQPLKKFSGSFTDVSQGLKKYRTRKKIHRRCLRELRKPLSKQFNQLFNYHSYFF